MPEPRSAALAYAKTHQADFLERLKEFIAIPSVSTDPGRAGQVRQAADWLADCFRRTGAGTVQVFPTARHPVVYGEWMQAGPAAPTVLVYGHYDVQPADPLDLWMNNPFEPVQVGDELFGRGASDMKGQILAVLSAVEAAMKSGGLPVNLKWACEGEEEIGSVNFPEFLAAHRELLASDFSLNPDAGMIAADTPTVVYGLRGMAYFELRVSGPAQDLHSGMFGGIVHNPAQALCELIAGLHDSQGHVTLSGFYDKVRPLSDSEREELARLPLGEAEYLRQTGAPGIWGEVGYTCVERIGARPTLEVNGMLSGFTGAGAKTIIPSAAMAKISTRLVPDQDPLEVDEQFRRYLKEHAPATISWELEYIHGGHPSLTDRNLPEVTALGQALAAVWGKKPVYTRSGGSIPVVTDMQKTLGIDLVLTGFGLPDDNIHSPNEKLHLPTWYRGIDAMIHFLFNLNQA